MSVAAGLTHAAGKCQLREKKKRTRLSELAKKKKKASKWTQEARLRCQRGGPRSGKETVKWSMTCCVWRLPAACL